MSEVIARLETSAAHALGSHGDGRGTHFSVVAADADKVELCLFDSTHRHDAARYEMDDCTDGVWRGFLPGCRPGQLYGYRVYGAYQPRQGHRFNPHKLLLDPYARQIAGELRWHDALYGYRIGSVRGDLSFDRRDSAVYMPKSVVVADGFDWGDDRPPRVPWTDTVIYEMHLRGFTRLRQDIPEHDRGTFGALGRADTVDYLRRLGVTAVELMPVHAFARDRHLLERGLTNYWGYNPLSWFAPEPQYLSDGTLGQIKWAVQRLHAAGIEVILDVVYNHTAEGSELGPTLCWRGYDNAGYYRLRADEPRHGTDDTGCGNTVNFSNPRTIQMVMDSLRYWVSEFHVDGFRFDLGVTLGREANGFDPGSGFFDALMQDPLLSQVKLISEPWDVGPGGYQLGNHPPGMAEWNGRYRDDVRRYWRGDPAARSAVAARLLGSADLFDHHRRRPWASINFVTAHDGFTLADLVSYGEKHNQAKGEDNNDGSNDNFSHHWGEEDGPSDDPAVIDRRDRLMRSLLTTLLVSHGTPMLLAGDEFAHSQGGNNNAYCQDNETSWLDWRGQKSDRGRAMHEFVRRLISLRRSYAPMHGRRFMHSRTEPAPGLRDTGWFDESASPLRAEDWDNGFARLLTLRRVVTDAEGGVDIALLLFNADDRTHEFQLPVPASLAGILRFRLLLDSAEPGRRNEAIDADRYLLGDKSVALLAGRLNAEQVMEAQRAASDEASGAGVVADTAAEVATADDE